MDDAVDAILSVYGASGRPREHPAPEEMAKPRDRRPIELVSRYTWNCHYCDLPDRDHNGSQRHTRLMWLTGPDGRPFGRCYGCGQLYVVAM